MIMKRLLWILVGTAVLACAQEKGAPAAKPVSKGPQRNIVVDVKYGDVNRIAQVLGGLGAGVRADPVLHVIAVGGDIAAVNAVEEAIKKMDVPPAPVRNVELTIYLLYGAAQESASASVPQDLDATVKQLRGIFPYKSYRLMDTIVLRARDGERAENSGSLPGGSRASYRFSYQRGTITGQTPRMLRIDQLFLQLSFPAENGQTQIQTNVDAREGQKTVVGKANIANTEDAVFLVITPKVIE